MNARSTKWAFLAAGLALALAACGTLEPNSAFTSAGAAAGGQGSSGAAYSAGAAGGSGGNVAVGSSGVGAGTGPAGAAGATSTASSGVGASGGTGASTAGGGSGVGGSSGGVSGADFASDTGVTPTSILIGNVTGVSGALGPLAFGVTLTGLQMWVDAVNAQGGINGRKVVLDSCDDDQDASTNLACTETLIDDKIFAFLDNNSLSSAGSAHPEYEAHVPDLGFPLNNGYFKYPNMFSNEGEEYPRNGTEVGFNNQLENGPGVYKWFATERGISRGAYFYYDESASQQAGEAQAQDAAVEGIKDVYTGGGSQGENLAAPNFDEDVIAMKSMGSKAPQAIFDAMDVNGNQKLCESMDRYGFTVTAKVSTIEVWNQDLGTPAWSKPCRDSIYVTGGVVSYADSNLAPVAQYLAAYKAYGNNALQSEWTLQAFGTGVMFADAVSSMGADVTRKGFIAWLDGLPNTPPTYTAHGFFVPLGFTVYNPATPEPDCTTIAQWQDAEDTFVTRAPATTCYMDAQIPTAATPDGS